MANKFSHTKYEGISVQTSFPVERRPIYIVPITSMARKNKENAYPEIAKAIQKIIELHPESKILVHTVSYELTRFLYDHMGSDRLITYYAAKDKQKAIDTYIYTKGSVLLAPSLDRGIDLPHDDCRVIVICKVPFPSLGDKQVSARLYGKNGRAWYTVRTIRSIVQMTGRGMRSEDDFCESYILDKDFLDQIWRRNKHLLPKWWLDALVWNRGQL